MKESKQIIYTDGLKYQLLEPAWFKLPIEGYQIDWKWLSLNKHGWLRISAGYAWNGASGPTFDTKSSIRPSLVHDALYQLIRRKLLPDTKEMRKIADNKFEECCIVDGMWSIRALLWFKALRLFGKHAVKSKNIQKRLTAP